VSSQELPHRPLASQLLQYRDYSPEPLLQSPVGHRSPRDSLLHLGDPQDTCLGLKTGAYEEPISFGQERRRSLLEEGFAEDEEDDEDVFACSFQDGFRTLREDMEVLMDLIAIGDDGVDGSSGWIFGYV
jgi:hypothetical protein